MKIALAQVQFRLGDFDNNYKELLKILEKSTNQADILVFPEGGLWSYPPKDFLYHKKYYDIQETKLRHLKKKLPKDLTVLLPAFRSYNKKLQNGVFVLQKNKKTRFFAKEFLPDEGVFFESRYFQKGKVTDNFFYLNKKRIQVLVCEDFWQNPSFKKADVLIAINASPFTTKKQSLRLKKLKQLAKKTKQGAIYLNLVGAQDSLIFDGASLALNSAGKKLWQGESFCPDFTTLDFSLKASSVSIKKTLKKQAQIEQALILGIKEFFYQTGFKKACLGLSGGIDSALVAHLAVQALGAENVQAYFLPTRYSILKSFKIVKQLSKTLKLNLIQKDIDPLFKACLTLFFDKKPKTLSYQNLQSRLRMLFLMAQANESSALLLGTSNKSEMAMGYTTIYGDMTGALCPIGDLFKTEVYSLIHFINQRETLFPKQLVLREPTAELDYRQKDQKELPPYKDLDAFLIEFIKNRDSKKLKLLSKVQAQEFKRKQAPFVLKVSEIDFGESWRYPIAHCFK